MAKDDLNSNLKDTLEGKPAVSILHTVLLEMFIHHYHNTTVLDIAKQVVFVTPTV